MPLKIRSFLAIALLVALPFFLHWVYRQWTRLPEEITIATGPPQGEWHALSHRLLESIESKTPVHVETHGDSTAGALHNLELLNKKEVDFALYLRGSRRLQHVAPGVHGPPPLFVGNIYSDLTLLLIRRDLYGQGITSLDEVPRDGAAGMRSRLLRWQLRSSVNDLAETLHRRSLPEADF